MRQLRAGTALCRQVHKGLGFRLNPNPSTTTKDGKPARCVSGWAGMSLGLAEATDVLG